MGSEIGLCDGIALGTTDVGAMLFVELGFADQPSIRVSMLVRQIQIRIYMH